MQFFVYTDQVTKQSKIHRESCTFFKNKKDSRQRRHDNWWHGPTGVSSKPQLQVWPRRYTWFCAARHVSRKTSQVPCAACWITGTGL